MVDFPKLNHFIKKQRWNWIEKLDLGEGFGEMISNDSQYELFEIYPPSTKFSNTIMT